MKLQDLINNFGDVIDTSTITAIFNDMIARYRAYGSSPEQVEKVAHHYASIKLVEMTRAI